MKLLDIRGKYRKKDTENGEKSKTAEDRSNKKFCPLNGIARHPAEVRVTTYYT